MTCPKCGGTVGPYSDLCLDCDYDAAAFTWKDWLIMIMLAVIIVLLIGAEP